VRMDCSLRSAFGPRLAPRPALRAGRTTVSRGRLLYRQPQSASLPRTH